MTENRHLAKEDKRLIRGVYEAIFDPENMTPARKQRKKIDNKIFSTIDRLASRLPKDKANELSDATTEAVVDSYDAGIRQGLYAAGVLQRFLSDFNSCVDCIDEREVEDDE